MMTFDNMKDLKIKKISINKSQKIINLFYNDNDFYYSIIYRPKQTWWEPIKNSFSLKPGHQASVKKEEMGVFLFQRSSLKAEREMFRIVPDKGNNINENKIINKSELINLK